MTDTQFYKGQPKTPGSGRKKGTPNKRNTIVHDRLTEIVTKRLDRFLHHMDYQYHGQNQEKANDMLLKLTKLIIQKPIAMNDTADDDENITSCPLDADQANRG